MKEIVLITGSNGGLAKDVKKLLPKSYQIRSLTTKKQDVNGRTIFYWDINKKYIDIDALKGCNHIIHLSGYSILKPWTKKNKKLMYESRIDGAIFQGCRITPYYDSLICKLICQGRDREEAIQRLQRSLGEFVIEGITTTIDLHKKILGRKKFINSDFDVNWLGKEKFY